MLSFHLWLLIFYFLLLGVLTLYGIHRLIIMGLFWYTQPSKHHAPPPLKHSVVTVQLPLYNEHNVADRIIDAAAKLSWPADKLEIQVLDDSDDETASIVNARVKYWQAKGIQISTIRRSNREGYKAGALAHGLKQATGDFIAIFDADFIPPSSFLTDTLPHFVHDRIGMVQARWGHLNATQNLLTRLSATLLDGHFVLEHTARYHSGRFFNFNGTAGVWRKACIDDAGGWQHDTITEDLDISYRAQLRDWTFVYLKDLVIPAEVPDHMRAFKSQQFRWAKGTLQTARKLLPRIWKSPLKMAIKAEATIHLTANIAYPLTLLLAVLMPATALIRGLQWMQWALFIDVIAFCLTTLSVSAFYGLAQQQSGKGHMCRILEIPLVLALGIGISLNQSRAVFQGLFQQDVTFIRTPKRGDQPQKVYTLPSSRIALLETCMAFYCTSTAIYLLTLGIWHSIPFLLMFAMGYGYVALQSLRPSHTVKDSLSWLDGQVDDASPMTADTH